MTDAAKRRIDVVVVWRFDRFGRNLRHLVTSIEELAATGVSFVSMGESIDTSSPTGRLLLGVFGSFAEFEQERIRERIHARLARARRQGQKLRDVYDRRVGPSLCNAGSGGFRADGVGPCPERTPGRADGSLDEGDRGDFRPA